jgi:hypothetical protein
MQYRANAGDKRVFQFPETPKHPRGIFRLSVIGARPVSKLKFQNAKATYEILSSAWGGGLRVTVEGKERMDIPCAELYDPFALTDFPINLFEIIGVEDDE